MSETEAREAATAAVTAAGPVLLFDGVCNLCNGAVQFIIRHDPAGRFRFAALQSDTGERLLREMGLPPDKLDTLVLVEDGRAHQRSTAALRIARRLSGLWPALFYLFIWVPRPLRDLAYDFVARNRYRWFGQRDECMVPTPELRARFLS